MKYKDYYSIMGVSRDASPADIKRAYRKLARKYHPDVSKEADAEEQFKLLGEAYEVLKDPKKRKAYDQLGADWKAGQEFRPPPDWGKGFDFKSTFGDSTAGGYSDFFETLFGGGFMGGFQPGHTGGVHFKARGEDHHAKVYIDIHDAFTGAARAITLRTPEIDEQGRIHQRTKTLNVHIPKGVKQGQQIRLAMQGAQGIGGGSAGDLYLEVVFNPHPLFRVDGRDIYLDLPLAPWEAALGTNVKLPTPTGTIDLKIPAGINTGRKMRLKERGIPGNPAGDLYAIIQIVIPPVIDSKTRALFEHMQSELSFNPREKFGV